MKKHLMLCAIIITTVSAITHTTGTMFNFENFSPNQTIIIGPNSSLWIPYKKTVTFTPPDAFKETSVTQNADGSLAGTYQAVKTNVAGKIIVDDITYTYEIIK